MSEGSPPARNNSRKVNACVGKNNEDCLITYKTKKELSEADDLFEVDTNTSSTQYYYSLQSLITWFFASRSPKELKYPHGTPVSPEDLGRMFARYAVRHSVPNNFYDRLTLYLTRLKRARNAQNTSSQAENTSNNTNNQAQNTSRNTRAAPASRNTSTNMSAQAQPMSAPASRNTSTPVPTRVQNTTPAQPTPQGLDPQHINLHIREFPTGGLTSIADNDPRLNYHIRIVRDRLRLKDMPSLHVDMMKLCVEHWRATNKAIKAHEYGPNINKILTETFLANPIDKFKMIDINVTNIPYLITLPYVPESPREFDVNQIKVGTRFVARATIDIVSSHVPENVRKDVWGVFTIIDGDVDVLTNIKVSEICLYDRLTHAKRQFDWLRSNVWNPIQYIDGMYKRAFQITGDIPKVYLRLENFNPRLQARGGARTILSLLDVIESSRKKPGKRRNTGRAT